MKPLIYNSKFMKPTGIVTFLFTDIVGSTLLSQEFPDSIHAALEKHDSILKKAIESNNGFIFKTIGDAYCSAFQDSADAIKAAVDIQTALANEKWENAAIRVRTGIHSGNAEWNGNDYSGYITLARVARVMSVAHGEQIIISENTHKLLSENKTAVSAGENNSDKDSHSMDMRNIDVNNISFRDLGERRLKDVIQTVRFFQVEAIRSMGAELEKDEQIIKDENILKLREKLENEDFLNCWNAGKEMTLEESFSLIVDCNI
ncbi:MAG TPA: adenylate/guanylate cyclase domain-containing protein [Ignavibacteria bacterium]|nr:adenylate/guanylate cyclase domain-containing protein [Ignavibacteria bacterium]